MKYKILLAGNPNVGKSTVFNHLSGENQHTGNWIGKTVDTAMGVFSYRDHDYELYDLPGTYSLNSHSKEEEVARDTVFFFPHDLVVVVVDAISLERNLNLVFQILEYTKQVVVCINLMDEARKKGIEIKTKELSSLLGVRVVLTSARRDEGLEELKEAIYETLEKRNESVYQVSYHPLLEEATCLLEEYLTSLDLPVCSRWLAFRLLIEPESFLVLVSQFLHYNFQEDKHLQNLLFLVRRDWQEKGITRNQLLDFVSEDFSRQQKEVVDAVVEMKQKSSNSFSWDRILTSKKYGIPIMILMLMVVFFLTISFSNYPSELLFSLFARLESFLLSLFSLLHIPSFITSLLVLGVFKTLSWVVSVMLPPMVIFFPMFSLLEDLGYLPRVAFNMDGIFQRCGACGKQALTMMMGFGCNAVGITGTRIIDSKKERLLAILTNSFVPCNGRFPMLIALISMFLLGSSAGVGATLLQMLYLTGFVLFACLMTFFLSYVLSKTLLKGERTSFTLELPPFRKPEILKTIVRSLKDKAFQVLKRAVLVSIPAGILIWIFANVEISDHSILSYVTNFLDPFAQLLGLDGVILTAFFLGFPANEIVIPIMIMSYLATGTMQEYTSFAALKTLFIDHGWTTLTAFCTILFALFHFPCSTSMLTIYHETKSVKWTLLSFVLPLVVGSLLCFLTASIYRIFV